MAEPFSFGGMSPRSGTPTMGAGLLGMAFPMFANQAFGSVGMLPGQFMPYQGPYDFYKGMQYAGAIKTMQSGMHEQIQRRVHSIMQGGMSSFGYSDEDIQSGKSQAFLQKSASNAASGWSFAGPYVENQYPGLSDALMGGRGDPSLFGRHMMNFGQRQLDPVTGSRGYSANSVVAMAKLTSDMLYESDPASMRGMGMGRVGEMIVAADRRGMGPSGGIQDADNADKLAELSAGKNAEGAMRHFDAKKTANWAKEMAGTVSALSDMFGPGKPIDQLFGAMNALSQGGMRGMSSSQMEMQIRTFNRQASSAGLSTENAIQLVGMAGQRAMQVGGNRAIAMEAVSSGMGWASAFRTGGFAATGKLSETTPEQMTVNATLLASQVGASALGLQTGATVRIGNRYGFEEGSEAAAVYAALKGGSGTYSYGGKDDISVYKSESKWRAMVLTGAGPHGLTVGTASQLRLQSEENMRAGRETPGVTSSQRAAQWETSVAVSLRRRLMSKEGITGDMADAIMEDMNTFKLDPKLDPKDARNALELKIKDTLETKFGMEAERATGASMLAYGSLAEDAAARNFEGPMSMIMAFNKPILAGAAHASKASRLEARMSKVFSKLGINHPLGNLVKALENKTPASEIAAEMAGGKQIETMFGDDYEGLSSFKWLTGRLTEKVGTLARGGTLDKDAQEEMEKEIAMLDTMASSASKQHDVRTVAAQKKAAEAAEASKGEPKPSAKPEEGASVGGRIGEIVGNVLRDWLGGGNSGDPSDLAGMPKTMHLKGRLELVGLGPADIAATGTTGARGVA